MNVVIIDKDTQSLDRLTKLLQESVDEIFTTHHASSVKNGVELIKEVKPDIVFISFLLEDGYPLDILRKVSSLNFRFFYISNIDGTLNLSEEHSSISYLLSPINKDKLPKIIYPQIGKPYKREIPSSITTIGSRIFLPTGGGHIAIKTDDIIKCVADGNYTSFYLRNKKHLVTHPIKYYDSLLRSKGFFRINRSVLVNIGHITAIYKKEAIVLTNNEKLLVSRRNKSNLKRLIDYLS